MFVIFHISSGVKDEKRRMRRTDSIRTIRKQLSCVLFCYFWQPFLTLIIVSNEIIDSFDSCLRFSSRVLLSFWTRNSIVLEKVTNVFCLCEIKWIDIWKKFSSFLHFFFILSFFDKFMSIAPTILFLSSNFSHVSINSHESITFSDASIKVYG